MYTSETIYYLALQNLPNFGSVFIRNLLEKFGSAEGIFKAKRKELLNIERLGDARIKDILNAKKYLTSAEKELIFIQNHNIQAWGLMEASYPFKLKQCPDAPSLIFFKGNVDLTNVRCVSIVGTRSPTAYGKWVIEKFIDEMPKQNLCIISGLAYGIDGIVHKLCLKHNIPSIGVMGHGFKFLYPPEHQTLAQDLQNNGGLMTEFLADIQPDKFNFPKRNRIVAGLSDATIVVETALKGGSMITADLAYDYNRDVFAFPGRMNDQKSLGCIKLICDNKAYLLKDAQHFFETMNWNLKSNHTFIKKMLFHDLNEQELKISNLMKDNTILSFDELTFKTELPPSKLSEFILELELKGLIKILPGKRFQWNS